VIKFKKSFKQDGEYNFEISGERELLYPSYHKEILAMIFSNFIFFSNILNEFLAYSTIKSIQLLGVIYG